MKFMIDFYDPLDGEIHIRFGKSRKKSTAQLYCTCNADKLND